MTSPMFDLPEHLPIGVDVNGNGPVSETDPEYVWTVCWCGVEGCTGYAE